MPSFTTAAGSLSDRDVEVLAIAAVKGDGDEPSAEVVGGAGVAGAIEVDLAAELAALSFTGDAGSVARIPTRGRIGARQVLVVGLGARSDIDAEVVRRAAAAVAGATSRQRSVATDLAASAGLDRALATQAVVEGFILGSYRFTAYKTDPEPFELAEVTLVDADPAAVRIGEVAAGAVCLARDLVNLPPADKRPPAFAQRIRDEFEATGVDVRVLDEHELEAGGYGGLLGVGGGSSEKPRLVELTWAPDDARSHVALVGKGITFDSGGLSLKPNSSMVTMKMDMAGAASVVAAVKAVAALELPIKVTGLCALAENMPSGTAIRPSDVLRIHGGKTVEVLNTDAEGRLVLADALEHASALEPDAIVDLATLTGAVIVALGHRIGGLMATDDALADALLDASRRTGEVLWRLPLGVDQYDENLKSDVADIRNSGYDGAGTIHAGLFLRRFVGDGIPWAHLDIAGIAWTDSASGYQVKGGTGQPVRTLIEWLRAR